MNKTKILNYKKFTEKWQKSKKICLKEQFQA